MPLETDQLRQILRTLEQHFTQGRWNDDDGRPRIHMRMNDQVYTADTVPNIADGDWPIVEVRWDIPEVSLDEKTQMALETESILKAVAKFPNDDLAVWDEEAAKIARKDMERALHTLRERFHDRQRQAAVKVFGMLTGLDQPLGVIEVEEPAEEPTLLIPSDPDAVITHEVGSTVEQRLAMEGLQVEHDRIIMHAGFLDRHQHMFDDMAQNVAYYLSTFDLPPFNTGSHDPETGAPVATIETIIQLVAKYDMMVEDEVGRVIEEHQLGDLDEQTRFVLEQALRGYGYNNDWVPSPTALEQQTRAFDNQAINAMMGYAEQQITTELRRMATDGVREVKKSETVVH